MRCSGAARQSTCSEFYVPASQAATFPWGSHALWFYSQMVRWGTDCESIRSTLRRCERPIGRDLYRVALSGITNIPSADTKIDALFDGVRFDPDDLPAYLQLALNR